MATRQLSSQISTNQRDTEISANVNKHWKTRAKGNEAITNVISANQHFASTFFDADIQIPETYIVLAAQIFCLQSMNTRFHLKAQMSREFRHSYKNHKF